MTWGPVARHRDFVHSIYGGAVGRDVQEVPTPALVLDLAAAERNIALMASAIESLNSSIRPHIKVHKSTDLARRQVAAGATGCLLPPYGRRWHWRGRASTTFSS